MKKKGKLIITALILAIAAYTAVVFLLKEKQANNKVIKVSGNIEGDDVRISFRITGQIIELLTDEGKVIRKGDIVARLNRDELSKVQAEAEAALKLAEYQYKLDYDDYVRAENLLKAGAISAQQRDTAKTRMNTDSANIKQLRASLELANTKLGWADLASPLDGYVLVKSALPGEVVQPGSPVFTAVNLDDLWVTAYINETDLGKVKLGQKAYVETDTYRGKKYSGRVSFISSQTEFTPKYIQTNEERVKYVYRIKVRVDNSSLDLKPGMPADAYIIIE
ncbi:MAG: efflux RND transporter periplasmic adaptor subunit [Candidatus Omnitrophica bacterium]|nr:efflux RND transporter periplasmic adaptor subunit [Candidatus Omnitrophota bacterium]MDD5661919.1 efflux RND transporter periplasmic adaptor subunit [Candidatus Omnitrophota bacterium]